MEEGIRDALARGIGRQKLESFYSDPQNQAEFEAWLEKRNAEQKEGENT